MFWEGVPWEGGGRSVLDRIVALRSAVRTMGGVFGGAEAIPVVETTTRSLRNVPKGKELVHYLPKKEARIRKINRFPDSQTAVRGPRRMRQSKLTIVHSCAHWLVRQWALLHGLARAGPHWVPGGQELDRAKAMKCSKRRLR